MRMVMTVLEAHVERDQWATLEQAYKAASEGGRPPQMVRTVLVQSLAEPTLWRAIAVWRSREALDEYRASVDTPAGVQMFRRAGAEPSMSMFEVVAQSP